MFVSLWQRFFQPPPPLARIAGDRRASARRSSGRPTLCEVITLPGNISVPVVVRDISETGLGLLCDRRISVGCFLAIEMTDDRGLDRLVRARVVHATFRGRQWLLGCSLVNVLSSAALQARA